MSANASASAHPRAAHAQVPANIVLLDGRLVPIGDARVSVLDRGFLFGDGVYELVRFFDRVGVGMDLHVRRLERSLELARISGFDATTLPALCDELLCANDLHDATVYLQVTRGAAPTRAHVPPREMRPTVMALATPAPGAAELTGPDTVRVVLLPDDRWLRCEIKTLSLMGNVLAAMTAAERGADEPILHRDGVLSEGGSTNVFLWLNGRLATPAITSGPPILHGVSRAQLVEEAQRAGIAVEERAVRVDELQRADEVMITSSRRLISSVVEIDGHQITGAAPLAPGARAGHARPMAQRLFDLLRPRLHSAS